MARLSVSSIFAAACLAVGFSPSTARADGGIPRGYDILFEPGNPERIVIRSDNWGMFLSDDGGTTWRWLCAEAYSLRSVDPSRYSMALLRGGSILAAGKFQGLWRSSPDACAWAPVEFFEEPSTCDNDGGCLVAHVATSADGSVVDVLTATGADPGVSTRVWQSTDDAATWTGAAPLPSDFSGASFARAPSDPDVRYVSGSIIETETIMVYRTLDGGRTWEGFAAPDAPLPGAENGWVARIAAVHPLDPSVVFLWVDSTQLPWEAPVPDSLWVSSDSAETWTLAFASKGDLPGTAFSPDGTTVLVSGPEEGIWSASAEAVPLEGQNAFEQVHEGMTWGLTWTETALHVGSNDFTPGGVGAATMGISSDRGHSLEPAMSICDAPMLECPAGSRVEATCPYQYTRDSGYVADFLSSARCAIEDGGTRGAGGTSSGGDGAIGGNAGASPGNGGAGAGGSNGGEDPGCACRFGTPTGHRRAAFLLATCIVFGHRVRAGRRRRSAEREA